MSEAHDLRDLVSFGKGNHDLLHLVAGGEANMYAG